MPVVICYIEDCSFATPDVANEAGAVILSHHLPNEHTNIASSTAPKIDPPKIESFALQWNEFEANTRATLKELRDEKEFCDVTLVCCDGKHVSAHKVILAGGSTFFQQVLKENPHPHPLIYLKGVRYEYLSSILDFVYTGEANINEKELESFLDVADDLQIKGLIEKNKSRKISGKEGKMIGSNVSHIDQCSDVKEETGPLLHTERTSHGNNRGSQSFGEEGHDDIDADLAGNMKVQLDGTKPTEGVINFKAEDPNDSFPMDTYSCEQSAEELYVGKGDFCRGFDNKNQMVSHYDITEGNLVGSVYQNENEENTYYRHVEGALYNEDVYVRGDGEGGENYNDQFSATVMKRKVCAQCGKQVRDNYALKVHMRNHTGEKPYPCLLCNKTFATSNHLKRHHTASHTTDQE